MKLNNDYSETLTIICITIIGISWVIVFIVSGTLKDGG